MIPIKVLAYILFLLTFVYAFPSLTLEGVDDSSIQMSNLVVRQTTPPVSVTTTGPESLDSTVNDLIDALGSFVVDLEDMREVLGNFTENWEKNMWKVEENVVRAVYDKLENFARTSVILTRKIQEKPLTNGPLQELFGAVPESLKILILSVEILSDALRDFEGDWDDIESVYKWVESVYEGIEGTVEDMIGVSKTTITLMVAIKGLDEVPDGKLDKVLNDFTELLVKLEVLKMKLESYPL